MQRLAVQPLPDQRAHEVPRLVARLGPAVVIGGEIQAKELTVSCLRCMRGVREYRRDLIARWGADALWRDVGQRLLNERCEIRTGSHEDDGCWPDFR